MSQQAILAFQALGISTLVALLISGIISFTAKTVQTRRKAALVAATAAIADTAFQGVALTVAVTVDLHLGMLLFFVASAQFFLYRLYALMRPAT